MLRSIFGSKKEEKKPPKADAKATIDKLRAHLELLEKREAHVQSQIDEADRMAREHSRKKNKRGALMCLKRKQLYDKQIQAHMGARLTIETQITSLEAASVNTGTIGVLGEGVRALREIHETVDVDDVDETMDDLHEEMARADEISSALANAGGVSLTDDPDLAAELAAMEEEIAAEDMLEAPSVPVGVSGGVGVAAPAPAVAAPAAPAAPAAIGYDLPAVPTSAPAAPPLAKQDSVEAEIAALAAGI